MGLSRRDVMIGALAAGVWPALGRAEGLVREGGHAFGSSWRIVRAAGPERVDDLVAGIVVEVDREMSPYRDASDLSRFNAGGAGEWHAVSPGLSRVTDAALSMAEATGGYFDPTVGPLVARLGFGPIKGATGPWQRIEAQSRALRKAAPGLTLDLCGIAKGHALDRITEGLAAMGIRDALIEVGGEVRGLGRHPDGRPWSVGISDPTAPGTRAWRVVTPGARALATSGHAANGVAGRVGTSHIVNPRNGRAAEARLLSVSVLSERAMQADALATALAAAGPVEGPGLARRLDLSALFIVGGEGGPTEILTGDFRHHLEL